MLGPSDRLELPLDEMIFEATEAALSEAGIGTDDIGLVCLAASDLFDGRGISTMTLTESTGSMGKWEHRVCNDSLVALDLAAAHIEAGLVDCAIVASWHKGSDIADPSAIARASLDPLERALGIAPAAHAALSTAMPIVAHHPESKPMRDVAVSVIVSGASRAGRATVLGHHRETAEYLHQRRSAATRLLDVLSSACRAARLTPESLDGVLLAGELADAAGVLADELPIQLLRESSRTGYCAGLVGIATALECLPGTYGVCSGTGIGQQEVAVTLVDVPGR